MITRRPQALAPLLVGLGVLACGESPPPTYPTVPPPAPEPTAAKTDPRYKTLPQSAAAMNWAPPAAERFELKNGVRVWHLEQGPTPLVSVQVVLPRGSSTDPKGRSGLASLLVDLLDEGAGRRSALELSNDLQELGTDYASTAGVDYLLLEMDLLAENFEPSMALLGDILRHPKLPRSEFDRRKKAMITEAIADEAEPGHARSVAVGRAMFGDGYASQLPSGTRESLERITYQDVKNASRALIAPEGLEIVVVGGIPRNRVDTALEKVFGDWKGKANAQPLAVAETPEAPPIYVVDYPGVSQSALAVVKRAPGARAADYFPALVYNDRIGQAFTSRLNLNLREDKGFTYGVYSDFRRYREGGYFGVFANVKTDTTRASIDEIFRELGAVCETRPLSESERNDAIGSLLLGYPADFERVQHVALRFASVPIYDRPADFWQSWPDNVAAVTTEAANEVGRKQCNSKDYAIVIAGDRSALTDKLSGLDRPIVELDRQGDPIETPPPSKTSPSKTPSSKPPASKTSPQGTPGRGASGPSPTAPRAGKTAPGPSARPDTSDR